MQYDAAKARLVDAVNKSTRRRSAEVITLGHLATEAIISRLRGVPKESRALQRARTITDLRDAISTTDPRTAAELTRWIRCYGTASAFGIDQAKALPLQTIRALSPLVKRNRSNEGWAISSKHLDFATALWAQAVTMTAAAIADQVRQHLHPASSRPKKAKRPRVQTIETVVATALELSPEEQKHVVKRILDHLNETAAGQAPAPAGRAWTSALPSVFGARKAG
jgi:hypothetical protein